MNKYNQLCVWECTTLGRNTKAEFEKFFKDNGFDIKFAEEVETNINYPYGAARHDVLFYINDEGEEDSRYIEGEIIAYR